MQVFGSKFLPESKETSRPENMIKLKKSFMK